MASDGNKISKLPELKSLSTPFESIEPAVSMEPTQSITIDLEGADDILRDISDYDDNITNNITVINIFPFIHTINPSIPIAYYI